MNRRRTPLNSQDLVWLTGWVFADLLLGLAIIFLAGSRGASPQEIAALTPSRTPTIGPSATPYPTYTPGPSPTPYPTYTRGPSPTSYPTYTPPPAPTAYPTYTPGPSPTPYPTYTPGPSPTPYPTWTPGPTATPYPTYTPGPTPRPSITIVAALSVGLDPAPYRISLRTDPSLFLSTKAADKNNAASQLRSQIHACLDSATGAKVGLVLGTGYNPDVTNGHNLVKQAMDIMEQEIPALFANTILKDYHALTDDPLLNGTVSLEVYFSSDPRGTLPKNLLGRDCTPQPKTWCQGKENTRSLLVFNWDVLPSLQFTIDNQTFSIKPASGTLANGADRTVGCIMLAPGNHAWSAGRTAGTVTVAANKDPEPIRLCGSPAQICSGGALPQTPAPGVK